MKWLLVPLICMLFAGCALGPHQYATQEVHADDSAKEYPTLEEAKLMSQEEWQSRLTDFEYYILWEKGTERAGTGDLLHNKATGTYVTAGCGIPVFRSEHKYDSGTGWPSFYQPIEGNIVLEEDRTLGIRRVEVLSTCGEHLGHVFPDGPPPTGERYCMNAAALDFIPD